MGARLAALIAAQGDIYGADCDLETAMQLIADKVLSLTSAEASVVELQEGAQLVYRAVAGGARSFLGTRVPIAGSLGGLAVASGGVLLCDDSETDPRVNLEACRKVGARSMIVVPLRHGGVVVGVLKVISTLPGAFTQDDQRLLEIASGVLAAALTRAAEVDAREALLREREAAAAEQERSAKKLLEMYALRSALFDGFSWMLAVVDLEADELRFRAVNAAMARLYGRTAEDLGGRTAGEAGIAPEIVARVLANGRRAIDQGRPLTYEAPRPVAGERRYFQYTLAPLANPEGAARCVVMALDITEQVLLQQRADVQDRLAVVGRLAAGMAHEANNPLAFILSNLHYVRAELAQREALDAAGWSEVEKALEEAAEGGERVRRIIHELHTFTGANQTAREPLEVANVVERAVLLTRSTVGARVEVEPPAARLPLVAGNDAQLSHVLVTLLINAGQAVAGRADGSIRILTGLAEDERVSIRVRDNGAGISREVLPRIFDPFFTTRTIGAGMGLGLSVALNLVKQHGGELQVRSEPGEGTEVEVLVPCTVRSEQ